MGEGELNVDVWKEKVQQDINALQNSLQRNEHKTERNSDRIAALEMNDKLQDNEIAAQKETLKEIKDDTSWIRRKITGTVITAAITAVVGGLIGIAVVTLFGGG